jgi:hypothetical protein
MKPQMKKVKRVAMLAQGQVIWSGRHHLHRRDLFMAGSFFRRFLNRNLFRRTTCHAYWRLGSSGQPFDQVAVLRELPD